MRSLLCRTAILLIFGLAMLNTRPVLASDGLQQPSNLRQLTEKRTYDEPTPKIGSRLREASKSGKGGKRSKSGKDKNKTSKKSGKKDSKKSNSGKETGTSRSDKDTKPEVRDHGSHDESRRNDDSADAGSSSDGSDDKNDDCHRRRLKGKTHGSKSSKSDSSKSEKQGSKSGKSATSSKSEKQDSKSGTSDTSKSVKEYSKSVSSDSSKSVKKDSKSSKSSTSKSAEKGSKSSKKSSKSSAPRECDDDEEEESLEEETRMDSLEEPLFDSDDAPTSPNPNTPRVSPAPTSSPVASTIAPVVQPTLPPAPAPTDLPTTASIASPSSSPTDSPTAAPTKNPTARPSTVPETTRVSSSPTETGNETVPPSTSPPSPAPSASITAGPSEMHSSLPTVATPSPTTSPTEAPSEMSSSAPTGQTTANITASPTASDLSSPPSQTPSGGPSPVPTISPTASPSQQPSPAPVATDSISSAPSFLIGRFGTPEPSPSPPPHVQSVLTNVALNAGEEFELASSYQYAALKRVEQQVGADGMEDFKLIQYYALYCIYESTFAKTNDIIEGDPDITTIPNWLVSTNWDKNDVDPCSAWYGVQCDDSGLVTELNLFSNGLSGYFPPEVILLASEGAGAGRLVMLDIFNNELLANRGDSSWITSLGPELQYLYFSKTSFSGHLPKFPVGLVELDVSYTYIDGGLIGSNFEGLDNLEWLVLDGNQYNAPIPAEIGQLRNLQYFYAGGAMITGDLSYMQNMPAIFEHWVDDNPGLTAQIPSYIGNLDSLGSFSASNCDLFGPIPPELGNLEALQKLWLYGNRLSGEIPDSLGNLLFLSTFEVEDNDLSGAMPSSICDNTDFGFLTKLGADCGGEPIGTPAEVDCPCCTCCSLQTCREVPEDY